MRCLILSITTFLSLHAQHIQFDHDTLDWGVVTYNSNPQRTFHGINISNKPIFIQRVYAGDPHWADRVPQSPIKPGEHFEIGITFPTTYPRTTLRYFLVKYILVGDKTDTTYEKMIWMKCQVLPKEEVPCFGGLGEPYKIEMVEEDLEFRYKKCCDTTVVLTIHVINKGCAATTIEDIWNYKSNYGPDMEYKILTDYKTMPIQPGDTLALDIELKWRRKYSTDEQLFLVIKQVGGANNLHFFIHAKEVNWVRKW